MDRIEERVTAVRRSPALLVALGAQALVVAVLLLSGSRLWVLALAALAATAVVAVRTAGQAGLQVDQMHRLRQAELALAAARDTHDAAQELADHAMALLGAPHATVLIEGIGDTVRVSRGDPAAAVYGDGSRMRLLDDAGVPCGSIAVSARADGRSYSDQQERMLDALAQRVSSTLHRLSLIADVEAERRTIADVLESSSDGIFTVGLDMAVRTWNPAMERILGVSAERAVGGPVAAVFRPVDEEGRPRHGQADPGRLGRPEVALVRVEAAAGDERWLTCSWAPLSEGGYVVGARDDTERKKLQDDKDGWIAQVSHELRTPLTPIKGFLHTLQRRDAEFETDQRQRIYEVMVREEQRLEDLVNALLQATTIDQRAVVVVPEVLDWPTLLGDQVELYRRTDPSRIVQVVVDPGVEEVVADANLATGVVANLLSNALKYSPEGSEIEVRARREGAQVVTTVTDRGPGVPADDRERIFDKFTRLGDHLTRPQQGVGLGLYIARSSVQQMGGRIWCAEAPGGGASFGFTLPVHAERADRPASAVPA
ncbi:MAG: PAS domain-containing sensor histidine kinase [Actinomycetota bacterium]